MIHETAIIGAPPFMYTRKPDGTRVKQECQDYGVDIEGEVDIYAYAIVVNGTTRPTKIGWGSKIGCRVQVGHDCIIEGKVTLCPGVIICGHTRIGNRTTVGVGAIVTPNVNVGDDCYIGAGVVVSRDLPPNTKITSRGTSKNWENLPWEGEQSPWSI